MNDPNSGTGAAHTLVAELLELLELERLEDNLFRGPSRDIGTTRVYGGQVLGQAIQAAQYTVTDRPVHSLHAYFLREGDHNAPIIYTVDRSRDGRSFSARRVVAIQHGQPIFTLAASFQHAEDGLEHQARMPEVPDPDALRDVSEYAAEVKGDMPEKFRRVVKKMTGPAEIRPTEPLRSAGATGASALFKNFWFRIPGPLPEDETLHRAILAYLSDYGLLTTALIPHGIDLSSANLQIASIDHAIWYHRPLRVDEWLLYSCDSPSASGARGLARGNIFTRSGRLVASTAQEGLIRVVK